MDTEMEVYQTSPDVFAEVEATQRLRAKTRQSTVAFDGKISGTGRRAQGEDEASRIAARRRRSRGRPLIHRRARQRRDRLAAADGIDDLRDRHAQ